jgi:hypothetical protein
VKPTFSEKLPRIGALRDVIESDNKLKKRLDEIEASLLSISNDPG